MTTIAGETDAQRASRHELEEDVHALERIALISASETDTSSFPDLVEFLTTHHIFEVIHGATTRHPTEEGGYEVSMANARRRRVPYFFRSSAAGATSLSLLALRESPTGLLNYQYDLTLTEKPWDQPIQASLSRGVGLHKTESHYDSRSGKGGELAVVTIAIQEGAFELAAIIQAQAANRAAQV